MKATQLLQANRTSVSALATTLANANIPGMKVKANQVISALAQYDGLSPEAFLHALDQGTPSNETLTMPSAIKSDRSYLKATFSRNSGRLCCIDVELFLHGYWGGMARIYQTMKDRKTGLLSVCIPSIATGGRDQDEPINDEEACKNYLDMIQYVSVLCQRINDNRDAPPAFFEALGFTLD